MNVVEQALVSLHWLLHDATAEETAEWVIFGSAVLYLHGLREPESVGDIDVLVSRRVWGELLPHMLMKVETPRAGDPPLLSYRWGELPIHLFYDWTKRDAAWMSVAECFESAEELQGWRCISLPLMRKHKASAGTHDPESLPKHRADLAVLDEHLDERSAGNG